jgi:hypothetical protein
MAFFLFIYSFLNVRNLGLGYRLNNCWAQNLIRYGSSHPKKEEEEYVLAAQTLAS